MKPALTYQDGCRAGLEAAASDLNGLAAQYRHADSGRHYKYCAERVRALTIPVAESGWRPIETAPKDGTPVLLGLVCPVYNRFIRFVGSFEERECDGEKAWGDEFDSYSHFLEQDYTHWMRLPAPPANDNEPVTTSA